MAVFIYYMTSHKDFLYIIYALVTATVTAQTFGIFYYSKKVFQKNTNKKAETRVRAIKAAGDIT